MVKFLGGKMAELIQCAGGAPAMPAPLAFDWGHALLGNLGFWITICVVLTAAVVNFILANQGIRNQTQLAAMARQADHQNKISEYRHSWLQELRNTAAELVKAIHEAQNTLLQMNLSRDYADQAVRHEDEELEAQQRQKASELYQKERLIGAEIYKFTSKIKLLFKHGDPQAAGLFNLLDAVKSKLGDLEIRQLDDKIIDEITSELQIILKDEWEVTKRMIAREIGPQ